MSSGDRQGDSRIPFVDVDDVLSNESRRSGSTAGAVAGQSKTETPDTNTRDNEGATVHPPAPRGGLGLRRLDPVFYLIVALAALGLVGSLYALISQNNAYFDREFQQLQRETAALNARLAANDAIINGAQSPAAVPEPEAQPESSFAVQQVRDSDPGVKSQVPQEVPVSDVVAVVTPAETVAGNTAVNSPVLHADNIAGDKTEHVITDNVQQSAGKQNELDSLKAELQNLQSAVNAQEALIQRLIEQNRSLSAAAAKNEMPSVATTTEIVKEETKRQPVPLATAQDREPDKLLPDKPNKTVKDKSGSDNSASEPEVSLTVQQSLTVPAVDNSNQLVAQAYNEYQMQNYDQALKIYQRAVQYDPYSRDANLGIAASAQFLGDYKLAEQHFRHLLSLKPDDAAAFSGLLNLPSAKGGIIELELQQHARQQGGPAALFAILGNYFARNIRWSEAESAYSTALQGDDSNADYLYNYAVVLDNLARHRESIHYYSRALEAAANLPFSFDRESAEKRLESLTRES